jgi:hypothetical protein
MFLLRLPQELKPIPYLGVSITNFKFYFENSKSTKFELIKLIFANFSKIFFSSFMNNVLPPSNITS